MKTVEEIVRARSLLIFAAKEQAKTGKRPDEIYVTSEGVLRWVTDGDSVMDSILTKIETLRNFKEGITNLGN